jgi:hypothetical protein
LIATKLPSAPRPRSTAAARRRAREERPDEAHGKLRQRRVVGSRHEQNVAAQERTVVEEGDRQPVLEHHVRRGLAPGDAAEGAPLASRTARHPGRIRGRPRRRNAEADAVPSSAVPARPGPRADPRRPRMAQISTRDVALGFALGLGAAVVAPGIVAALRGSARPLAKTALKGALAATEGGAEKLAELREHLEDLFAEVAHELERERPRGNGADGEAAPA